MFELHKHPGGGGGVNRGFTKKLRNLLDCEDSARLVTKSTIFKVYHYNLNQSQVGLYLSSFTSNTNGHIYSRGIMDLNPLPSRSEL